ncbi:helix-turn-helix transcriptional regulator [Haladaptatus sp. NG-WS-4]
METQRSLVEYVLRSGARTDVLSSIADGCTPTQELLECGLASESAVYNALSELEDCGLIYTQESKQWTATGTGSVIAALIERQQQTENVLQTDLDYWNDHDVTALPVPFRHRLAKLSGGTVVRATETQPSRAAREIENRLETADSASVVAPIFSERYSDALLTGSGASRLVLDSAVVTDLRSVETFEEETFDDIDIRVADVSFALAVMDGCLLLSLPTLDGSYDTRSEFVVESERACRWGTSLFEQVWSDAPPVEEYV